MNFRIEAFIRRASAQASTLERVDASGTGLYNVMVLDVLGHFGHTVSECIRGSEACDFTAFSVASLSVADLGF